MGDTVSTIGEEKAFDPRLQVKSVDEYVDLMNNLNLPNPKMMDVAVPANLRIGFAQSQVARRGWAITAPEALALVGRSDVALVDLRETQERDKHGTIPGSLHAPYSDLLEKVRPGGMVNELAAATGKRIVFYCRRRGGLLEHLGIGERDLGGLRLFCGEPHRPARNHADARSAHTAKSAIAIHQRIKHQLIRSGPLPRRMKFSEATREFLARHARTSRNFGRALSSDGRGRRLIDIVRLDHPFAHLDEPITKSFRAHALGRYTRTFEHQK